MTPPDLTTLPVPRAKAPAAPAMAWAAVGPIEAWTPWTGRAALVGGQQVAIFRLGGPEEYLAIANRDPFSEANVLARGIVGDADGVVHVASPIRKQRFDLQTGACLDDEAVSVPTFEVRVEGGFVHVLDPAPA